MNRKILTIIELHNFTGCDLFNSRCKVVVILQSFCIHCNTCSKIETSTINVHSRELAISAMLLIEKKSSMLSDNQREKFQILC